MLSICSKCNNDGFKIYRDTESNNVYLKCSKCGSPPEKIYIDVDGNQISYETKVINDLLKYGFILEKDKIILKDLEAEVKFLEEGLEELATRYEIFTTEKFKNINIKKKTSISSMFRIGQDNILSYNFNIGDINSDELVNIFANMKDRKKMWILGLTFILTSGIVYLMFMLAWLNLATFISKIAFIRLLIAVIALVVGLINIYKYIDWNKNYILCFKLKINNITYYYNTKEFIAL